MQMARPANYYCFSIIHRFCCVPCFCFGEILLLVAVSTVVSTVVGKQTSDMLCSACFHSHYDVFNWLYCVPCLLQVWSWRLLRLR
jgi:hypothetical protein